MPVSDKNHLHKSVRTLELPHLVKLPISTTRYSGFLVFGGPKHESLIWLNLNATQVKQKETPQPVQLLTVQTSCGGGGLFNFNQTSESCSISTK